MGERQPNTTLRREYSAPSERFFSALQRYAGSAEDNPLPVSIIGDNQMRNVMRTQDGPSQVYYFDVNEHDGLLTGIETGKVVGEFIKTRDYGISIVTRTVVIKEGQGIIVMQKNSTTSDGKPIPGLVDEFEAIKVYRGQKPISIHPGFFYALVNTDKYDILIAKHYGRGEKNSPSNNPNNEALRSFEGFAFSVVSSSNGKPVLEKNSLYRKVMRINSGGLPVI